MRPFHQRPTIVFLALVTILAGDCTSPRAQAAVIQELNDAANQIDGLKNDIAQLQTDMDSLRTVVLKQDSVLSRIVATMPR